MSGENYNSPLILFISAPILCTKGVFCAQRCDQVRSLCTKGVFCAQRWDQVRSLCTKGGFCALSCSWRWDLEQGSGDFRAQKKGKLDISHRYNRIPLLPSGPGGILQELVVYDLPGHKGRNFFIIPKLYCNRNCLFRHCVPAEPSFKNC